MKYKITGISEPANDMERQKVKGAKKFNSTVSSLVNFSYLGGMASMTLVWALSDRHYISAALLAVATLSCSLIFVPVTENQLGELYKSKENCDKGGKVLSKGKRK